MLKRGFTLFLVLGFLFCGILPLGALGSTEDTAGDLQIEGSTYWTDEGQAATAFAGGKGTLEEPYLISQAGELAYLAYLVNLQISDSENEPQGVAFAQKHYRLTQNIDLQGQLWQPIGGGGTQAFSGSFDGNGYQISNLTIRQRGVNQVQGLFGMVGAEGQVKDLYLASVDIQLVHSAEQNQEVIAAGLVGRNEGLLENCVVTGAVKVSIGTVSYAGGLVGSNQQKGKILNCRSAVQVSGVKYRGGLVAYNLDGALIQNSSATGAVAGEVVGGSSTGGLVETNRGRIDQCFASGEVQATGFTGQTYALGGLVGSNSGYPDEADSVHIRNSYAIGKVQGAGGLKGAIGGLAGENSQGAQIQNCFATGSVTNGRAGGNLYLGGLVGVNKSENSAISNVFSAGLIVADAADVTGGVVGENQAGAELRFAYYNATLNEQILAVGASAGTETDVQGLSTYALQGIEFRTALNDYVFAHSQEELVNWLPDTLPFTLLGYPILEGVKTSSALGIFAEPGGRITKGLSGNYVSGQKIQIAAQAEEGYHFAGWVSSDSGVFEQAAGAETVFTMPENATEITAKFSLGAGSGAGKESYTITVLTGPGGTVDATGTVEVIPGQDKTFTFLPEEGYQVQAVQVDGVMVEPQERYTFTLVNQDHELKVEFAKAEVPQTVYFVDIERHWGKVAITEMVQRGVFKGISETQFDPDGYFTRGMFVTALGLLEKVEPIKATGSFGDVPLDAYYAPYVDWALQNKIVSGLGDNRFAPMDFLTREQMATALTLYANYKGYALPALETRADEDNRVNFSYADAEKISSWAQEGVWIMTTAGVMQGKSNQVFDPQGLCTRAEAAMALKLFLEHVAP